MATPAELRAKLLAKRSAQQEEAKRKTELHNEAKIATHELIMLGLNFEDILTQSEVSAEHLASIFKAIGFQIRRSRYKVPKKDIKFGASRWLDHRDEFIIDIDEGTSEEEEVESDENEPTEDHHQEPTKSIAQPQERPQAEAERTEELLDTKYVPEYSPMPDQSPTFNPNDMEVEAAELNFPPQETNEVQADHANTEMEVEYSPDMELVEEQPVGEEEQPVGEDEQPMYDEEEYEEDDSEFREQDLDEHESPPSFADDVDDDDEEYSTGDVQRELERVKAQIIEIQHRKEEREAQKLAEQEMAKRNMELRDIASRRALLAQKKEKIDLEKFAQRVSDIEYNLNQAKKQLEDAKHAVSNIDSESAKLEKQELKLRRELARPRAILKTSSPEEGKAQVGAGVEEPQESGPPKPHVLTARDSPLRAFSSFRMCSSLGPSLWFSKTFNSRFVPDLQNRSWSLREGSKSARAVGISDFEVSPQRICEYMATRHIDDPEFREDLMNSINTYLVGPEVTAEQLAAVIIGVGKKHDSTRILDWEAWGIERPF